MPYPTQQPNTSIETWIDAGPGAGPDMTARLVGLLAQIFHTTADVELSTGADGRAMVRVTATPVSVIRALRRCEPELARDIREVGPRHLLVRLADAGSRATHPTANGSLSQPVAPAPAVLAPEMSPVQPPASPERGVLGPPTDAMANGTAGILSWEAFVIVAMAAVAHAKRHGASLALALVGVEPAAGKSEFHQSGHGDEADRALRLVEAALLRTVRAGDLVGRYSGSGYAVLAQDAQRSGALRLAERFVAALPAGVVAGDSGLYPVSIGIATFPRAGTTLPALLCRAEEALDAATRAGPSERRISVSRAGTLNAERLPDAPSVGSHTNGLRPDARSSAYARTPQPAATVPADAHQDIEQAIAAYERGEIEGVGIETRPGACAACLDAARDLYVPRLAPELPLPACTSEGGCRCRYAPAAPDPRRRPPPIPALSVGRLEVPRQLRAAALFGSDPDSTCEADDAAAYLDQFPLLPFEADLPLETGEVLYLMRPAKAGWEAISKAGRQPVNGGLVPPHAPFLPWKRTLGKLPALPAGIAPRKDDGVLYVTNWRVVFRRRDASENTLLADLQGVECFRDGLLCTVAGRQERFALTVRDPLTVGLYLTRAIRDVAALLS